METIYVAGFEGKTHTFLFPSVNFQNLEISELKSEIHYKVGIPTEHQRLLFGWKELESERCGHMMTLSDYGITGGSFNITCVLRMPGGASGLNPVKFADITSEDKFIPLDFTSSAPKWRRVSSGLNFEGICKQYGCVAFNSTVIVNRGFYKSTGGHCMLNFDINNLECPMCQIKLNKKEVRGIGIFECQLTVKCKQEEDDEISYDIVSKDKYQYAGCMEEKDQISYDYILLIVKEL